MFGIEAALASKKSKEQFDPHVRRQFPRRARDGGDDGTGRGHDGGDGHAPKDAVHHHHHEG